MTSPAISSTRIVSGSSASGVATQAELLGVQRRGDALQLWPNALRLPIGAGTANLVAPRGPDLVRLPGLAGENNGTRSGTSGRVLGQAPDALLDEMAKVALRLKDVSPADVEREVVKSGEAAASWHRQPARRVPGVFVKTRQK